VETILGDHRAMRIKVCYLIGTLGTGGAEGQVVELIRRLDRNKFDLFLVLETGGGTERVDGLVPEARILRPNAKPIRGTVKRAYHAQRALRNLISHMNEIRPDILHAFLPGSVIYAGGARVLRRVPVMIASRRSLVDCYRPNSRLAAIADNVATRSADFVLGNSQAIIQEVIRLDGVPSARTQVIYNGVDTESFSPLKKPGLRAEFGWGEEHLVFGMVANFIPYKRHLDFVDAAVRIHAAIPQSRFLLVGEDRGEMPKVQNAIASAGLGPYTRIIPGTKAPEMAFATMNIYVCTSETEGFSNVVLEAMATGLPIIATDVGGNKEAVEEGSNGSLVPAHAPARIANAALELATNPNNLRGFALNSRNRAESVFSVHKMVQAHEDVYIELSSLTNRSCNR
jgi:glycosyltransferase involved in cell wall biosynthesis